MKKRLTRQQAINAKCKECIYDPLAGGTWRMQTGACEITDCALWPYRPRSRSAQVVQMSTRTGELPEERAEAGQ